MSAIIAPLCVFAAFCFGVFISFASGWAYRAGLPREAARLVARIPTDDEVLDSYLWKTDRVLVNEEIIRDFAEKAGFEIVDRSDRKQWIFRKPEASA